MSEPAIDSEVARRPVGRKRWAWALSAIWIYMPPMGIAIASVTGIGAVAVRADAAGARQVLPDLPYVGVPMHDGIVIVGRMDRGRASRA